MTPTPRMEDAAPYRWRGAVTLDPKEVKQLIRDLIPGSPLRSQLQKTAAEASAMAAKLNALDKEGIAV